MSIISTQDLMNEANLGKQTDPAILTPHINSAEIELKRILGAEKYSLVESYQASSNESEAKVYNEVRKGAVYLAMSYAVHSLNIETQGSGLLKIKGWDQSRSELLTRDEIRDLSAYFRQTAMMFLQPHIPVNQEDQQDKIDMGGFYLGTV